MCLPLLSLQICFFLTVTIFIGLIIRDIDIVLCTEGTSHRFFWAPYGHLFVVRIHFSAFKLESWFMCTAYSCGFEAFYLL